MSLTPEQQRQNADLILRDLRRMREDALKRLDDFTAWIEDIGLTLNGEKPPGEGLLSPEGTARWMHTPAFAARAAEKMEDLSHIHTGSTAHMYYRQARDNITSAVAGEELW